MKSSLHENTVTSMSMELLPKILALSTGFGDQCATRKKTKQLTSNRFSLGFYPYMPYSGNMEYNEYDISDECPSLRTPGGYTSEFLVGVCRPVPQILTQFQTKIFHFPHPFSDLCWIIINLRINNEHKNCLTVWPSCFSPQDSYIFQAATKRLLNKLLPKWDQFPLLLMPPILHFSSITVVSTTSRKVFFLFVLIN